MTITLTIYRQRERGIRVPLGDWDTPPTIGDEVIVHEVDGTLYTCTVTHRVFEIDMETNIRSCALVGRVR